MQALQGNLVGGYGDERRLGKDGAMITVRASALQRIADLAMAVIQDRGDAPFVWCHFPYMEYEGRTTFREFADGSVLALDTDTGQWMVPWQSDLWTDHEEEPCVGYRWSKGAPCRRLQEAQAQKRQADQQGHAGPEEA